jgi:hypothetical protein
MTGIITLSGDISIRRSAIAAGCGFNDQIYGSGTSNAIIFHSMESYVHMLNCLGLSCIP